MLVLGLESSCDETAAALVEDGTRVLADVVASQADVHARYGGVVPELASRHHVVNIVPVLETALEKAQVDLDDIDGIAVTSCPGLVGALLVALQTAKAIAYAKQLPLVGIHHLEGHLTAVYLAGDDGTPASGPAFPHLALLVSGGHSSLIRVEGFGQLRELGATRDDAAGEAFDKVAKMLGLGYPGGVQVDRLAAVGDPTVVSLPRLMTAAKTQLDFSFSGVKTAVRNYIHRYGRPEGQALADLCASFQATVVELLVRKTRQAVRTEGVGAVQLAGGVAANRGLRSALREAGQIDNFGVYIPPPHRCTDNAAMIAAAGFHRLKSGERAPLSLNARANMPLPR